jgi:methionyl-tRNA formyltransferase
MPARKFAITASDAYLGVMHAFMTAGWEPIALYCSTVNGDNSHYQGAIKLAQQLGITVHTSRLDAAEMEQLKRRGCELLVIAGYDEKIGPWEPFVPYAVNFHPSLLPQYRGPIPQVHGILRGEREWGVSCHKLTDQFDAGDILLQQAIVMEPDETLERLNVKIQMQLGPLAFQVATDFDALWNNASPQGPGSYFKRFSDEERLLQFHQPVALLDRQCRAFGHLECLADVGGVRIKVQHAVTWKSKHDHAPGTVVSTLEGNLVVAAADGYVAIICWALAVPGS